MFVFLFRFAKHSNLFCSRFLMLFGCKICFYFLFRSLRLKPEVEFCQLMREQVSCFVRGEVSFALLHPAIILWFFFLCCAMYYFYVLRYIVHVGYCPLAKWFVQLEVFLLQWANTHARFPFLLILPPCDCSSWAGTSQLTSFTLCYYPSSFPTV